MILISDSKLYAEKEQLYIAVRSAEHRVIGDEILKVLPYPPQYYVHYGEWHIRARSFERFSRSLKKKHLNILDLGCGNGWMANKLYQSGHRVTGVDINLVELEQAEKVFGSNDRLQWVYTDILKDGVTNHPFDLIVLGASCQYFHDITMLTDALRNLLAAGGEIHLLDSFFYTNGNIEAARQRTKEYYLNMGYPQMAEYYHHHLAEDLKAAGYRKHYPGIFTLGKYPEWWIYKKG